MSVEAEGGVEASEGRRLAPGISLMSR